MTINYFRDSGLEKEYYDVPNVGVFSVLTSIPECFLIFKEDLKRLGFKDVKFNFLKEV